jgi:hypothetical protein
MWREDEHRKMDDQTEGIGQGTGLYKREKVSSRRKRNNKKRNFKRQNEIAAVSFNLNVR